MAIELVAKSKLSNIFRWVRIFLPIVLIYIIWIACGLYVMPYVSVSLPTKWHGLAWISFIILIPFIFLPFVLSGILTQMGWTIGSKKLWIRGYDFCVTRGPGKNVKKDIIPGTEHPEHGPAIPDSETQDYGSVHQLGMEGPYDVVYPVGCIEDDGIVAEIIGNAHAYEPELLPEPIRSRYIRDKIDPVTGETVTEVIRRKKKVTLVLPALNKNTNKIIGVGFDHALVETQQATINHLRENLRRLSKKYGEPQVIREVDSSQPPLVQSQ